MTFPMTRMRRLRTHGVLRNMIQETRLHPADLILPLFVCPGTNVREEISAMPGTFHLSVDQLSDEAKRISDAGITAILLFGLPDHKDEQATGAYDAHGTAQRALSTLKEQYPSLLLISDVCLCAYTTHGHCGVVTDSSIDNDTSLQLLAQTALSHAVAGADMVAPSDMMDGRVQAIRHVLDTNGYVHVPILSYAAKYASAFYGPFREAADSAPQFGDRKSYQMNPANSREALREVALDIDEGADMVMVKPAMPYLDVIAHVKNTFTVPVAAYQVSGEFAMIKSAAANGWINEEQVMMESVAAIKRAGADVIITYFAREIISAL